MTIQKIISFEQVLHAFPAGKWTDLQKADLWKREYAGRRVDCEGELDGVDERGKVLKFIHYSGASKCWVTLHLRNPEPERLLRVNRGMRLKYSGRLSAQPPPDPHVILNLDDGEVIS